MALTDGGMNASRAALVACNWKSPLCTSARFCCSSSPPVGVGSPAARLLCRAAQLLTDRDEGWGRRVGSQAGRGGGGKGREREPSPWIHGNNTPSERGRDTERLAVFWGEQREPSTLRIWTEKKHWKRQGSCSYIPNIYCKGGKPAPQTLLSP